MPDDSFFIEDTPLQILFLDQDVRDGKHFFENGLGTTWFDYDLHMTDKPVEAASFLERAGRAAQNLDLVLISNRIWFEGGESFVRALRRHPRLAHVPVYCVASCSKKLALEHPQCWAPEWRRKTCCRHDARIAALPFQIYLDKTHPAHINNIVCADNIDQVLPQIVNDMSAFWFTAPRRG